MDTSEQYIKMCFEAWPHLKEAYQPSRSDFYKCSCKHCRNDDRIFMVNDYDMDYCNKRDLKELAKPYADMIWSSEVDGFGAYWDEGKDGFFIVWKQDQLQKMIEFRPYPPHLIKFVKFVQSTVCGRKWMEKVTMEKLWLAFVMKEKYGKTWNGIQWVRWE